MEPNYWAERLTMARAKDALHRAVFEVGDEQWEGIVRRRRRKLFGLILPDAPVIDIGCAWGWNRDVMPESYRGRYVGIDICPEFIDMAQERYPADTWLLMDARKTLFSDLEFDHAMLGSIKGMLISHKGLDAWEEVEREVNRIAKQMHILEYNE